MSGEHGESEAHLPNPELRRRLTDNQKGQDHE